MCLFDKMYFDGDRYAGEVCALTLADAWELSEVASPSMRLALMTSTKDLSMDARTRLLACEAPQADGAAR
jgi:hypothetical protein